MDAVDSLPDRPLSDAEIALLNRAEPVTLAVAVDEALADGETRADEEAEESRDADGVLVATESAVIGLALTDGTWAVVDRLDYGDGVKRYDALRSCESAVRHALGEA